MSEASWREARCDGDCGADHAEMHRVIAKHIGKLERQAEHIKVLMRQDLRLKAQLEGAGRRIGELSREIKALRAERDEAQDELARVRASEIPGYIDEPGLPEVTGGPAEEP